MGLVGFSSCLGRALENDRLTVLATSLAGAIERYRRGPARASDIFCSLCEGQAQEGVLVQKVHRS